MKRILLYFMVLIMSLSFSSCVNSKKGSKNIADKSEKVKVDESKEEKVNKDGIKVFVDGEEVSFEQYPVQTGEGVFVSIKEIAEKKQAEVSENGCDIKFNDGHFRAYPMVAYSYYYNYILSMSDTACFILNEKLMVPLNIISRVLSSNVEWDEINKIVYINSIEIDEDYYSKYKANMEEPLVVEYDYNNERCKVPQLNIDHPNADAINKRILNTMEEGVDSIRDAEAKGYDSMVHSLVYYYSVNGDVLSLLYIVNYDAGDLRDIYSVNYDLKNNRELSFDEIMSLCGQNKDRHIENTHKRLMGIFEKQHLFVNGVDVNNYVLEIYETAGSDKCYSDKSALYIEKSGSIMAAVDFPSLAGADSYMHLYDTGLKLKKE